MTGTAPGEDRLILSGIRVIDAATWIAGPTAATVMADFGADVIKVEPPAGDGYRRLNDTPGSPVADTDYAWQLDNRSKRGITMDPGQDRSRAVAPRWWPVPTSSSPITRCRCGASSA